MQYMYGFKFYSLRDVSSVRQQIYSVITSTLKQLLSKEEQPTPSMVPSQAGPPATKQDETERPDPRKEVSDLIDVDC